MNNDRLKAADLELLEFFTSAIDVSGQSYEFYGASGGWTDADKDLVEQQHRRAIKAWELTNYTLSVLDTRRQRVIHDVYHPYGEPDLRAIALRPAWGSGSFVRLAPTQPRALAAFVKRFRDSKATSDAVGCFLRDEAARGSDVTSFFKALRDDCEEVRRDALVSYAALMRERAVKQRESERESESRILRGERPSGWRLAS